VQRLARERDTCRRIFEKRCLSDLEFELLMLWDDAVWAQELLHKRKLSAVIEMGKWGKG
jgi:hypothetical protein